MGVLTTARALLADLLTVLCIAVFATTPAVAQIPAGYPTSYTDVIAAAKKEGQLRIYSSLDEASAKPLLDDFAKMYPGIEVEFSNLNSNHLYNRVLSEAAAKQPSADFVWTGGSDQAVSLAADGYVAEYASPEGPSLPQWAVWKNMVYGITAEPYVFLYNKRALQGSLVPQSHAQLLQLVKEEPDVFRDKVILLDPTRTTGLMMNIYDAVNMPNFFVLIRALAGNGMTLQTSNAAMIEKVSSGEAVLAWNVDGAYVAQQLTRNPSIGQVMPSDYTLVRSRAAFITKAAANPNTAKLMLDYLVSKRGQKLMADASKIYAAREDIEAETSSAMLRAKLGPALRPLPINEELIERVMNDEKRLDFLRKFQDAMRRN